MTRVRAYLRSASDLIFFPIVFTSVLLDLGIKYGPAGTWSRWRAGRIKLTGAGHAWVLPDVVTDQHMARLRAARDEASK
jgi:hypothetical protein